LKGRGTILLRNKPKANRFINNQTKNQIISEHFSLKNERINRTIHS